MNTQYRNFNGPTRYSSRQQILGNRVNPSKPTESNEVLKLQGKMRSIQDDIHAIRSKNDKMEQQNGELIQFLQNLKYNLNAQSQYIQELNEKLSNEKDEKDEKDELIKYEQNLKTVGQRINFLNLIIQQRNQEFTNLKLQKKRLQNERRSLKEQSNILLYNENIFHEEINQIVLEHDFQHCQEEHDDLTQGIIKILAIYQQTNTKLQNRKKEIQVLKKETKDLIMDQKEKRIQLQYRLKLLKQRQMDQAKKKEYYKQCYDQDKIQEVIDDMLTKEDNIRQEISNQLDAIETLKKERQQAIARQIKRMNRAKHDRSQQIKTIQSKNQMLSKEHQILKMQVKELSSKITKIESQGPSDYDYVQEGENELKKKIKQLQDQNGALQIKYNNMISEVELLQKQLIL